MRSILGLITASLLAGSAFAADAPVYKSQRRGVAAESVPYTWEGLLFGFNIGYGQTTGDGVNDFSATNNKKCKYSGKSGCYYYDHNYHPLTAGDFPGSVNGDADGLTVGGQVGYRKQFGQFTLGGIVDWEWSNIKGTQNYAFGQGNASITTKVKNIGTVVGELGWAPGQGATLFAVDGGFAWGTVQHTISSFNTTLADDNATKTGWTVGGKIEHMWSDGWSIWTGYRYVRLGSYSNTVTTTDGVNNYTNTVSGDNKLHEIRVGFHKMVNFN